MRTQQTPFFRIIVRNAAEENTDIQTATHSFFAGFNLYTMMAHTVGEILHIRPNEILDTWGVPELIVAYGQYMNEKAQEAYQGWVVRNRKTKEDPMPSQYYVRFIGVKELEELENG